MIEWDTDIPALDVLLDEARLAREALEADLEAIPEAAAVTRPDAREGHHANA